VVEEAVWPPGGRGGPDCADLTLEDFSRFVGVSPETIGKTLREFEDRGWIRLDDMSVVVIDSQALASVRSEKYSGFPK
jgi:DNA-binding transcriptional regulator YhcF (GntR family)